MTHVENRGLAGRLVIMIYAGTAYLAFLASFTYFIAWSLDLFVPQSIDDPAAWLRVATPNAAVAFDLGLILLFGLQHSIMARSGFKDWLARVLPRAAERATFIWFSSLLLALVMLAWQPLPGEVWQVPEAMRVPVTAVNLAGWLLIVAATFMIDHFDFAGLRQAWSQWRGRVPEPPAFVTRFAYRFVRHPMMTGLLIGLWLVPMMSWGHLLLSFGFSAYIVAGTHFEERDLITAFGDRYREYRRRVPMLLPSLLGRRVASRDRSLERGQG